MFQNNCEDFMSAETFVMELNKLKSQVSSDKIPMRTIFSLAKRNIDMQLSEIEKLLKNDFHEFRVGAVSIMDFQARGKINDGQRKALFELYINNHGYINKWDLVDRSAPYVVGRYLFDKSRDPLYELAKSENIWERRTSIVSTYYFIRENDLEDTFKIAEILIHDNEPHVQKAVGSWIREAGKKDQERLKKLLDNYVRTMPRVMLRYATEKFDQQTRKYYMELQKN